MPMTRRNHNALILFCRTPGITRARIDSDYAALPWNDLHALFSAFLADLLMTASHLEATDVLVYRDPAEWSVEEFLPFRQMMNLFDLPGGGFCNQVGRAINQAFTQEYGRVVAVLENDPTISAAFLAGLFNQLGYEDDCVVLTPTREGKPAIIGFKANHTKVFDPVEGDPLAKPDLLLSRLCALDAHLFLTKTSDSLENGTALEHLGRTLRALDQTMPSFPGRSAGAFAALGRKYGRKRSAR